MQFCTLTVDTPSHSRQLHVSGILARNQSLAVANLFSSVELRNLTAAGLHQQLHVARGVRLATWQSRVNLLSIEYGAPLVAGAIPGLVTGVAFCRFYW